MTSPEPTDVDALIADFVLAVERGESPNPADWLARHPAHAAEMAAFLLDLGRFGSFLGLPSQSCLDATTDFRKPPDFMAPPPTTAGKQFAEYELLAEIGQGGMGTVYQARLMPTSLVVALKQIRPCGLDGEETVRRFREEVESAAGLRHPNIVPIFHVGEHEGQPFYTMALIERGSLDHHMGRYQGDFRRIAELLAKIARAVHHAHQRRILHRDLKPGNVLLDQDWVPHVADFGLAIRLDEAGATTEAESPMGSLRWMAPEAVRGDSRLTTAVDVWALGVILYELLTGVRPFGGDNWRAVREAILKQEPSTPRTVNPQIPRDLDAVCRRCLEKDADQRYESANALALDLERWLQDEPVRARMASRTERFSRWCRRNPALAVWTAILFVWLTAGTVAGFSLIQEQERKLRATVRHTNEFAARHVSNSVHQRLNQLARWVIKAANDKKLLHACKHEDLDAAREALQHEFQGSPFATVYLLDPMGKLVAHAEVDKAGIVRLEPRIEGTTYPGRDYFQGALRHQNEEEDQDRIHQSRAFQSESDLLDKVAISCSMQITPKITWVLAATITTDDSLGITSLLDESFTAVLLAPRDTARPRPGAPSLPQEYVILVHPAFSTGVRSVRCRPGFIPPGDGKPELRPTSSSPPFDAEDDYRDPIADNGHAKYSGRWLTGSARVANTELVVLVQQRYDVAVASHQALFRRFVVWIVGTVAAGFVSFVVLRWLVARRDSARKPRTL